VTAVGVSICAQIGLANLNGKASWRCFHNLIQVAGNNQPGDSGSLVLTNDASNQPVGMVVVGDGTKDQPFGSYWLVPIAQIEQDLGSALRSASAFQRATYIIQDSSDSGAFIRAQNTEESDMVKNTNTTKFKPKRLSRTIIGWCRRITS
jgi:hypothetical protein